MKKITLLLIMLTFLPSLAQFKEADFTKGLDLIKGSDQPKALLNLEMLEKKFPNEAKVIFLRGFYQFRDGDQNGALMNVSNAIKIDPKLAMAYESRSQLFEAKGMLDKSISDMSAAISIEPKKAQYYYKRANYYSKTQQNQEALNDYKTIIKLAPEEATAYYEAATLEKLIDPNANADLYFTQSYAVKGIKKYVTDFLFAKFLMNNKRFNEAKVAMESSLAQGEADFDGDDFNIAALIFYKTKNHQKAIEYFNKAIAKNPDDSDFRCNLAGTYVDLKDWSNVKETAEKALALNANHVMSNMYMAIGLKWTGNEKLALEYEAKAKRLDAEQNKK